MLYISGAYLMYVSPNGRVSVVIRVPDADVPPELLETW